MDAATLAARLEQAELEARLKPYQVADAAQVVRSRYYQWRQGKTEPTVFGLAKVAVVLGVSIDWLVGRTDDPKVIPYGQTLIDEEAVARIRRAKSSQDIADLIGKKPRAMYAFIVKHGTAMLPTEKSAPLLAEIDARLAELAWKGVGKKERGSEKGG